MNTDNDMPAVDSDAVATAEPQTPAEPKRRTRRTKAEMSAARDAEMVAGDAPVETPAPPPKRARRAPKTEAASDAGDTGSDGVSELNAAPQASVAAAGSVHREPAPEAFATAPEGERRVESTMAVDPRQSVREVATGAGEQAAADAQEGGAGNAPSDEPAGESLGEGERRGRRRNRRRRGQRHVDVGAEGPIENGVDTPEGMDPAAPDMAMPVEFSTQGDPGELFAKVISGDFDVDPDEGAPKLPGKRVLPPEPESPKLHKVLAQAGVGSRRDMEQLILDGRITVNGEAAHTGQRISYGDQIRVAGKLIKVRIAPPLARVLAYHKPAGEVVTHDDPQQRPTVFRRLPRLSHGKWQSVGRLDINTEGLLLFTNSGDLANKLMHPRFGVEREYAVRVLGTLDDAQRASLLEGVVIDGQPSAFKSIEDGGGEGANRWYRVVITEGRNREVRKLFEATGMAVSRLIRIRYGSVVLPKGLRRGVWIDLEGRDVQTLKRLAGGDVQAPDPRPPGPGVERAPQQQRGPQGDRNNRNDRGDRQNRNDRGDRGERQNRNDRGDRAERPPSQRDRRPQDEGVGTIPNPLQQTYDRRPLPREHDPSLDHDRDDENIGPIPNPLQQTYDRRFVQKPRGPGGGQRGDGQGGQRQPDPMQTSVGYIGADTFLRKMGNRGGPRRKR